MDYRPSFLGSALIALAALWLGKGVLLSFVGLPLAAQVLQVLGLLYLWEMAQGALGRDVQRLTVPPTWTLPPFLTADPTAAPAK